jgi:lipopolysaccharide export LptBFGC system permease protein LptF
MNTPLAPQLDIPRPGWQQALGRRRRGLSTPASLCGLAAAAAAATVALVVLMAVDVGQQDRNLRVIGDQAAPVVVAAGDLYFALNDMDAQVANVLLVGAEQGLGFTRDQALMIYEQRRRQADSDLQRAASATTDADTQQAIRDVLDQLGQYEALAAQAILLDTQDNHAAGHPPADALAAYRQATDLLATALLPAAQALTDRNARSLEDTYQAQRGTTLTLRTSVAVTGAALLAVLVVLQVYLYRRFHRILNPALALATLLALGFTVVGVGLLGGEAEHLRVAKKDAFDSVLALTQARAVSYDANADESRYLVDPGRADQYQQAFLAKSQRLVGLPGATIDSYDIALSDALRAYQADTGNVGWQGFYGTEFRNVTFIGEREAAEATLARYQSYQLDDRHIRQLATSGQLRDAIAFCTSYAPGESNYAFDQYDKALAALIAINQNAFASAIAGGRNDLRGWQVVPWITGLAILALSVGGIVPRITEYR